MHRLCLGLAQLLHPDALNGSESPPRALQLLRSEAERQLTPALEPVLRALTATLRQEVSALQHVVRTLEQLGGSAGPPSDGEPAPAPYEIVPPRPKPLETPTDSGAWSAARPLSAEPPPVAPSVPRREGPAAREQEPDGDADQLPCEHYEDLAQAHAAEGDWPRTIETASAALDLNPASISARFLRGAAHFRENDTYRALADFNELIRREPNHVLAHNERGAVNACMQRYDRALGDYETAIRLNPQLDIARYNRAVVLVLANELGLALTAFNQLARIWPTRAVVFYQRGRVQMLRSCPDRAVADFRKALELDPAYPKARHALQSARELLAQTAAPPAEQGTVETQQETVETRTDATHVRRAEPKAVAARAEPARVRRADPKTVEVQDDPTHVRKVEPKTVEAQQKTVETQQPPHRDSDAKRTTITITCTGCGSTGHVPLDRLNRQFKCQSCHKIYFVSQNGTLSEVKAPVSRTRYFARGSKVAAAALLLIGAFIGIRFGWQKIAKNDLAPLPTDLETRVQLMGGAWLRSDDSTMRRLTYGPQGRSLKYWLQEHPTPLPDTNHENSRPDPNANVTLRILNEKRDSVDVVVVVTHPLAPSPVSLTQEWVREGDTWYFKPYPDNSSNANHRVRR